LTGGILIPSAFFAFYINATSTQHQKNGIRDHSPAIAGTRRHRAASAQSKLRFLGVARDFQEISARVIQDGHGVLRA